METIYFTEDDWMKIRGLLGVKPGETVTAAGIIAGLAGEVSLSLSHEAASAGGDPLAGFGDLSFGVANRVNPLIEDAKRRAQRAAAG